MIKPLPDDKRSLKDQKKASGQKRYVYWLTPNEKRIVNQALMDYRNYHTIKA